MKVTVDLSKVTPAAEITGENPDEGGELRGLLQQASRYLESFAWCGGIEEAYMGLGFAGIVGVFLFHIRPAREDVDEWIWVVVGDLPPAYITAEDAPNAACALDGYIGAMQAWVDAVKAGEPVDGLIPVNVAPTLEHAARLESRLQFLDREILALYRDDLEQ